MQRVELLIIFATVAGVLILLALRRSRDGEHGGPVLQVVVGSAIGLTAAFIVLVLNVDLIPDQVESTIGPFVVVAITSIAIVGTVLRLARR